MMSSAALADVCYKDLAFKLANSFCPYFKNVKFDFDKIKTKEFKDKSKEAIDYVGSYEFEKAATIWKAILDADPYTAAAAYNLGSLNTIVGNYDEAYQFYKTAAEIDEAEYGQYVKKAEAQVEMNKILKSLGITIEKQGFESSATVLSDKIKTKGSKSDRFDVREKPDENSASVARIPGDTEFTVISQEGNWYLIKLLGGKQGYINQSFIK